MSEHTVETWATCPPSPQFAATGFRRYVIQSSQWAEAAGCRGLLVFTDHRMADPWVVAQLMIEHTERIVPLVAAQPPYLHPFAVARMVSTLGYMYGRPVDLNLVTGGNARDLVAVGSKLAHDVRYERLVEFGRIIQALLTEEQPVTLRGTHYRVAGAQVRPTIPGSLRPRLYVAGSSSACQWAAGELDAARLTYPPRTEECQGDPTLAGAGIRIGIIARETRAAAWRVADRYFPPDPSGEQAQDVAAQICESHWHQRMSEDVRQPGADDDQPYWLYPFRTAKEFCPYLVDSYTETADVLARYLDLGIRTIILQIPRDPDDLHHAATVVARAQQRCRALASASVD